MKVKEEAEATVIAVKERADKEMAKVRQDFEAKESVLSDREEGVGQRETLVAIKEHNIDKEIKNKALAMIEAEIDILASATNKEKNWQKQIPSRKRNYRENMMQWWKDTREWFDSHCFTQSLLQ